MPMTAQTKHPQMLPVSPEARPEPRSPAAVKETKEAGPRVYWGDRLTVRFWLYCLGLLFAMELLGALHRLVLFLMGQSPAP